MKKRRMVEIFASSLICLSLLTGCTSKQIAQDTKYCYELTHGDLSEIEIATTLCADISYINCGFKNASYVKTLVSKDKPIYIVPTEKFLKWNDYTVESLVNELNTIFNIINDDIKFIYQETMPDESYNVITIDVVEELDSTGVTYMQDYVKNNDIVYNNDCRIEINKNYWYVNFFVELRTLLAHEVAHCLGLGHPTGQTFAKTIMSCDGTKGANGYYTLNDMYNFAILYGGFDSKEEVLSVKNKLKDYYNQLEQDKPNTLIPITSPLLNNKPIQKEEKQPSTWFERVNNNNNSWQNSEFNK